MATSKWGKYDKDLIGSEHTHLHYCANCNHRLTEGYGTETFCTRCGNNLSMVCPACHNKLRTLGHPYSFCSDCGVNLQAIADKVAELTQPGDKVVIVKVTVKEIELEIPVAPQPSVV